MRAAGSRHDKVAVVREAGTPDPASPWHIGQNVTHPKFGAGVIVNAEGRGADARVQVNFHRNGTKWLALEYAKLERGLTLGRRSRFAHKQIPVARVKRGHQDGRQQPDAEIGLARERHADLHHYKQRHHHGDAVDQQRQTFFTQARRLSTMAGNGFMSSKNTSSGANHTASITGNEMPRPTIMLNSMRGAAARIAFTVSGVIAPAAMVFAISDSASPATTVIPISIRKWPTSDTPPMVTSCAPFLRNPLAR